MSTEAAQANGDVGSKPGWRRLRRALGLVFAPLVFGGLLDGIATIFHWIDMGRGDPWKQSWTEDLALFPILAYVGSLLPALVVVTTLFLTGWRSDARKVMGVFTLTCIVMMGVAVVGSQQTGQGFTAAKIQAFLYTVPFVCVPGLSISGLYCFIAGVPWRRSVSD
jgi:hypothetical protein